MNGYMIALICVFAVVMIAFIVRAVTAYVKANKEGIIRMIYPASVSGLAMSIAGIAVFASLAVYHDHQAKPYKEFLDDLNARGTAPLVEYYGVAPEDFESGTPEDERPLQLSNAKGYCKLAIDDYTHKKICNIFFVVEFAALILVNGTFITRNGKAHPMNKSFLDDDMSNEFFACVKGKRICFYDKDDSHKLPFSLPATGENLMLCDDFIRPEVLDNTKPAEQNR